ncbi:MAG: PIN domain-containing protein [Acidobacteria bacterium]|nr:PIN domain-containing protein [Acidobacteriota bacterium]
MIEAVLDTNVLVAALRSSRGAARMLLMLIGDRRWRPNLSQHLMTEYEAVLKRVPSPGRITPQQADELLNYIASEANLVQVFFRWRPFLPDPKDDFLVELAMRVNGVIVTYNQRHFREVASLGLKVMTPIEFLRNLELA